MNLLKKIIRAIGYVLLIIFISVAVSLGGGVPISRSTKRKDDLVEVKIELVEPKVPDSKTLAIEIKS